MKTDVLYLENKHRLLETFSSIKIIARKDIWADVPGYERRYKISSRGVVKSLARKTTNNHNIADRIMCLRDKEGYGSAPLSMHGKTKESSAHRLVAMAFLKNPEGKTHVNHIDGNKANNCWWNLEWVSHKENVAHAVANNLLTSPKRGKKKRKRRLSEEDLNAIRISLFAHAMGLAQLYDIKTSVVTSICRKISVKSMTK